MINEAQRLLSLLKEERRSLQRMIREAIREGDYDLAAAHNRALNIVLRRMHVITSLEDVNVVKKDLLKRMLRIDVREDRRESPFAKQHRREFDALNRIPKIPVKDSRFLEFQLGFIVAGAIRGINIVSRGRDHFTIRILHEKGIVKILFPGLTGPAGLHNGFTARTLERLTSMGFAYASEDSLEKSYAITSDTVARMMALLSVMVFEILHISTRSHLTYFEVID